MGDIGRPGVCLDVGVDGREVEANAADVDARTGAVAGEGEFDAAADAGRGAYGRNGRAGAEGAEGKDAAGFVGVIGEGAEARGLVGAEA